MLAQAVTGTPGHVNAMADAVAHFIRRIGRQNIFDGDVYITNDPWEGTGHLHDITMVTPSFHNGVLVGFFACTAHIVDIGGRGFGADAHSVYEEGLYIPIMKFADKGDVDETLIRIIRGNVREPDQLIGDIYALATCNEIGHRRLIDMMEEFTLVHLDGIAEFILDNSRRATIERIAALPQKSAQGEMTMDGFDRPITLKVRVSVEGDRIVSDFAGSSGLDKKGINCPLVYAKAYTCYALKVAIAPEIPNNAASLAPFEIEAPENTIVNALHPAPVALRHIVGHFVPDAVFDAFDKIVPGLVPAEGAGCLCNFQVSLRPRSDAPAPADARRSEVLTFNSGGSGARPEHDGLNATAFPSGVMTMPIEATEHAGPVIIWRKELRPDSAAVRARRVAGLGQYMEVGAHGRPRVRHPGDVRSGRTSRARAARAVMAGALHHHRAGRWHGRCAARVSSSCPTGASVVMAFPGGAGYGYPAERPRDMVLRDLARGIHLGGNRSARITA